MKEVGIRQNQIFTKRVFSYLTHRKIMYIFNRKIIQITLKN